MSYYNWKMAAQNLLKKENLKHNLNREINIFQWANNENDHEGRYNDQKFCETKMVAKTPPIKKVRRKGIEELMNCDLKLLFF